MWRWLLLLLVGIVLAPVASEALDAPGAAAPPYRAMGEMRIPAKIHSSWGKRLNPTGAVPNRGFKAIYFNRTAPGTVVFQENVESVAIKYAWADFHRIDSPQFGGYWVGKLRFAKPTIKQVSVSQSWAKSRILIDGKVVFDGTNSGKTFTHKFAPGEHVIEVEYINNWHTTEYKVTVEDVPVKLESGEVSNYLARNAKNASGLYYVGLYESAAQDTSVSITVPRTRKPAVLWLTSYEAVDWNIQSSDPVTVIIGSHAPGSRVRGRRVKQVVHVDGGISISRVSEKCSCSSGYFHCEQRDDLENVAQNLRSATGLSLTGYAVKYSASNLTFQPYGQTVATQILGLREKREKDRKVCERSASPDFDNMME